MEKINDNLIFGLDIGTRSIVGIVGLKQHNRFNVLASHVELHETRAMIDGQIHDINRVAATIVKVKNALENKIGKELNKVCIAAAGRVLKTMETSVSIEIDDSKEIDKQVISSLELQGMEKAMHKVNYAEGNKDLSFYCVGYSVVNYYLNDFEMKNLEGHKGSKIGADILSTFLPFEVVNSLYKVIEQAGLEVYSLTLEPIAAIEVAIPMNYRLLNIALVDIGAGTSDIAITKNGSIIAYGMIPYAGDEITESIVHEYLVDFATAEKIKIKASTKAKTISFKDAIGMKQTIQLDHVRKTMEETKKSLASHIAKKIIELNGDHKTNAVFIVGGGGQIKGFEEILANEIGLHKDRVAIRGKDVLNTVTSEDNDFKKNAEFVTPVGICLTGLNNNQHDFIEVFLNDESIRIFNTNRLTVMDVVALKGIDPKSFLSAYGKSLDFTLNGADKSIKGTSGTPAKIYVNQKESDLSTPIKMHDYINIIPAENGQMAKPLVRDVIGESYVYVNGDKKIVEDKILINNVAAGKLNIIHQGDDIKVKLPDIKEFLNNFDIQYTHVFVNEEEVNDGNELILESKIQTFYDEQSLLNSQDKENLNGPEATDNLDIVVVINNEPVKMTGKNKYNFVDIFDYIDFDRTKSKGTLISTINGENCAFIDPIVDGDHVEILWKEPKPKRK